MRPHPDHLNGFTAFQHLITQTVLNIDPAGTGTGQIAAHSK